MGAVNYLRLRIAYDHFCPRILIGGKGKELDREQLQAQYRVRKFALSVVALTLLCWALVFFICQYLPKLLGLSVFILSAIAVLMVSILLLRLLIINHP